MSTGTPSRENSSFHSPAHHKLLLSPHSTEYISFPPIPFSSSVASIQIIAQAVVDGQKAKEWSWRLVKNRWLEKDEKGVKKDFFSLPQFSSFRKTKKEA